MKPKLRYWILIADLLWITTVFVLAHWLQYGFIGQGTEPSQAFFLHLSGVGVALSVWTLLYLSKNLEGFTGAWHLATIFSQQIIAVFYLMGFLMFLAFLMKFYFPTIAVLFFGLLLPVGPIAIRCVARWLVISRSRAGAARRVVILGRGHIVRELAVKISRHPETSMEVVGVLFQSDTDPSGRVSNLPAGTVSIRTLNILSLIQERKVRELIVVEPLPPGPEIEKLISTCRKAGMRVHLVPQHYELYLLKAKLTEIDDVPLLSLEEPTLSTMGLGLKRAIDFLGASLLLILCAPLLVFSAMALRWKKGMGFRRELRCGKNGTPFQMYRLNIDRDAANLGGFERVLVHFSFSELPQLWNVWKGDMSLVGPRPESPERVKHYSVWQHQRLTVTPGLTGLAQVNGLREQHSSEEKARFDLQYIFHWSVFLDLCLLLQTLWTLFVRMMEKDRIITPATLKPRVDTEFMIQKVLNADSA